MSQATKYLLTRCQQVNCNANSEMRCKACKFGYCSVEHQREHWSEHKEECKRIGQSRNLFFEKFDKNLLQTLCSKEPGKVLEVLFKEYEDNEKYKPYVETVKENRMDGFMALLQNPDLMDDYALSVVIYQMYHAFEDLRGGNSEKEGEAEGEKENGGEKEPENEMEDFPESGLNESERKKKAAFKAFQELMKEEVVKTKKKLPPRGKKSRKKKKKKKKRKQGKDGQKKKPIMSVSPNKTKNGKEGEEGKLERKDGEKSSDEDRTDEEVGEEDKGEEKKEEVEKKLERSIDEEPAVVNEKPSVVNEEPVVDDKEDVGEVEKVGVANDVVEEKEDVGEEDVGEVEKVGVANDVVEEKKEVVEVEKDGKLEGTIAQLKEELKEAKETNEKIKKDAKEAFASVIDVLIGTLQKEKEKFNRLFE